MESKNCCDSAEDCKTCSNPKISSFSPHSLTNIISSMNCDNNSLNTLSSNSSCTPSLQNTFNSNCCSSSMMNQTSSSCCPPKNVMNSGCCSPGSSSSCYPSRNQTTSSNSGSKKSCMAKKKVPNCSLDSCKQKPCLPPGKNYTIDTTVVDHKYSKPCNYVADHSISSNMQYTGKALMAVTLPLGGLGTGTIAFSGDGGLRQWQPLNVIQHEAHVPHSFWAIKTQTSSGSTSVVLQTDQNYDQTNFIPAPLISDHVVPPGSIELLKTLPGIPNLILTSKYPIIDVDYQTPTLPVTVHLETYNPYCPLDVKNSAIPGIIFNFTVSNPSNDNVVVTMMMTQQNFIGWNGYGQIQGVSFPGYGGNVNATSSNSNFKFIQMTNQNLSKTDSLNGTVSVGGFQNNGDSISFIPQWTDLNQLWKQFNSNDTFQVNSGVSDPSPSGQTYNGAVLIKSNISAKSNHTFSFMLLWHFPNHYVNYGQPYGIADEKSNFYLGNQYAKYYPDMNTLIQYVLSNFNYLQSTTRLLRDTFYSTTLPWQLLESVGGRFSVVRTPTCMFVESGNDYQDGRLHPFEGCNGYSTDGGKPGSVGGCCPMDCTHVWNYEMTTSRMFPTLEQGMRITDLIERMSPYGYVPERTILPSFEMAQEWIRWPNNFKDGIVCMDGELGTVLKCYREILQGAPRDFFDLIWPKVKLLMQHIMTDYDTLGDGIIRVPQFNTYDCQISGANTFIGTLYLAALRAAEEMAKLQNDLDAAARYRQRYQVGSINLDKFCWNEAHGFYVNVGFDPHSYLAIGDGCFTDSLLGQWWAHILGLGYLLPEQHVILNTENIFHFNRQVGFSLNDQAPRKFVDGRDTALWTCRWPDGGKPPNPILYWAEAGWTGIEYPIASNFIFQLDIKRGITVLSDLRERYDGTRRSPLNEIECGDHYSRSQSAHSLLDAATGVLYNAPQSSLSFDPKFTPDNFQTFFITESGWGNYSQQGSDTKLSSGKVTLTVLWGQVTLNRFGFTSVATNATVTLNGNPVSATSTNNGKTLFVNFSSKLLIPKGGILVVTF